MSLHRASEDLSIKVRSLKFSIASIREMRALRSTISSLIGDNFLAQLF
jgi:hypothetical protein